jgi:hypothetical protein
MSQPPKRSGVFLVLGGAVVAAAAVVAIVAVTRDEAPVVAPPPPVTAQPSPSPSPTPAPRVQPEPFDVTLRGVGVQEMGNGWIYRRRSGNTRKGAAKHARAAVAELNRYLDAALVDPATRFTDGPVNRLLTRRAQQDLNRRGRRALGVGAPEILGGRTGRATARAIVLYDGKNAHAVTVTYRARMNVSVEGARRRQPLEQDGVMMFVPTRAGWRAEMVDVRTRLPQPGPPGSDPSPSPSPPGSDPSATPSPQTSGLTPTEASS